MKPTKKNESEREKKIEKEKKMVNQPLCLLSMFYISR